MNIQFVRLELDVCEKVNQVALEQHRTVSELVNELLRVQLRERGMLPAQGATSGSSNGSTSQ